MAAALGGEDEIDRMMAEAEGSDAGGPDSSGVPDEALDATEADAMHPEVNRDYQSLKQAMVNEMVSHHWDRSPRRVGASRI